jgi:phage protein D
MKILYNGVDISPSVQPTVLKTIDHSGGQPDRLELVFSDTEGLWSQWDPAKNDTLQVIQSGFDTGLMYRS